MLPTRDAKSKLGELESRILDTVEDLGRRALPATPPRLVVEAEMHEVTDLSILESNLEGLLV